MSVIVSIRLETDLSEFSSTVTDGGDLSWSASAALASTAGGLSCLIDDTTAIYGQKTFNKVEHLRGRFYVDPNTLTMAANDKFIIHSVQQNGASVYPVRIYLQYVSGQYNILTFVKKDGGLTAVSDDVNITDAPHYIEYYYRRAATDVSADGTFQWWVDGVDQGSTTGIDNFNTLDDLNLFTRLGAIGELDAGTSGTFYLDELVINDDGSEIGPHEFLTMTAAQGSFALTGQASGLLLGHKLAVAYGTFALTGQDVTLTYTPVGGYTLTAAQGSFVLTGQAANLLMGRKLASAYGTYSLAGQASGLLFGHRLTAVYGTYTLTGQVAGLLVARKLVLVYGAYTLTGQAAGLLFGHKLTAAYGAYTLTGEAANLLFGHKLTAAYGSYALTGQAAALRAALRLTAAYGTYTLTGQNVTFTLGVLGVYTLTAAAGLFVLTGYPAQYRLQAAPVILTSPYKFRFDDDPMPPNPSRGLLTPVRKYPGRPLRRARR